MERLVKTIYMIFAWGVIVYFVYGLFQGKAQLHWLGLTLLCNAIIYKIYPVTVESIEEQAMKNAKKIFSNPVLANDYLIENKVTQRELDQEIASGKIKVYELDQVLIIENI